MSRAAKPATHHHLLQFSEVKVWYKKPTQWAHGQLGRQKPPIAGPKGGVTRRSEDTTPCPSSLPAAALFQTKPSPNARHFVPEKLAGNKISISTCRKPFCPRSVHLSITNFSHQTKPSLYRYVVDNCPPCPATLGCCHLCFLAGEAFVSLLRATKVHT